MRRDVSIPDRRRRKEERRKGDQSDPDPSTLPPHSIEAEQSLIGGLLLDNSRYAEVAAIVSEQHIYRNDHRRIFRHIARIIKGGGGADVVTVFASLESGNEVDLVGGLAYLGDIANNTPSAANILTYARIVRERAILRSLLACGGAIVNVASQPGAMKLPDMLHAANDRLRAVIAEWRGYSSPTVRP